MSEHPRGSNTRPGGISIRTMEIAVALVFLLLGGLVVYDSLRLGIRWVGDGPQAGYFPFYIGTIICIASLVNLGHALWGQIARAGRIFVEWGPLRQVLAVLIPAGVFVLGVGLIGIYISSAVYIAGFMIWIGKYRWLKSVIVGVSVSVVMFMMFEVWFKVPLYKGAYNPLSVLGY
jgi:hypothetical protein